MNTQRSPLTLEQILQHEVECTEHMIACLRKERSALTSRNLEALEEASNDKNRYAEVLEDLDRGREQSLRTLGYTSDTRGMNQCFSDLPNGSKLSTLWDSILANLRACQDGNITNGGILEHSRHHVEQALGILRGQSGAPAVYSSQGSASADLGQRELGKV